MLNKLVAVFACLGFAAQAGAEVNFDQNIDVKSVIEQAKNSDVKSPYPYYGPHRVRYSRDCKSFSGSGGFAQSTERVYLQSTEYIEECRFVPNPPPPPPTPHVNPGQPGQPNQPGHPGQPGDHPGQPGQPHQKDYNPGFPGQPGQAEMGPDVVAKGPGQTKRLGQGEAGDGGGAHTKESRRGPEGWQACAATARDHEFRAARVT